MATPPDFVAGAVLQAAQLNKIGLWLVKTQTIGTAVSSVTVTGAFSADYDNYRIILTGGVASTSTYMALTLGSTATGYYYGVWGNRYDTGGTTQAQAQNAASWPNAFYGNSDSQFGSVDVFNPFNTKQTGYTQQLAINATTTVGVLTGGGYLANTTSYTAFTLTTVTGGATLTGGTIRVYGYRN